MMTWNAIEHDVRRLHRNHKTLDEIRAEISYLWPEFQASPRTWKLWMQRWGLTRPHAHQTNTPLSPYGDQVAGPDSDEGRDSTATSEDGEDAPALRLADCDCGARRSLVPIPICPPSPEHTEPEMAELEVSRHPPRVSARASSMRPPPHARSHDQPTETGADADSLTHAQRVLFRTLYHCLWAGDTYVEWPDVAFRPGETTFLHYAAGHDSVMVLERVIGHLEWSGVPLSRLVDERGQTAVFPAVQAHKPLNVKLLLEADRDLAKSRWRGANLLHFAISHDAPREMCKLLFDNGVDMRERDDEGLLSVELAVAHRRKDLINFMIIRGRSFHWTGQERMRFLKFVKKHSDQNFV